MKQTSMFSFSSQRIGLEPDTRVVDLFCGIGGFSCGAKQAGHRVVCAVDCDPFLLGCHVRNNPSCVHICCKLPRDDLPFPTDGKWHLHGSPPCTKLSIMRPHQYENDRQEAIDLVSWFLSLVKSAKPSSWSMEQVNHRSVRQRLIDLKRKHPLWFDWTIADAVDYQVPQYRKRLIAGSPCLISNLRASKSRKRKLCVRDVIHDPPKPFIRNNLYSRPDEHTLENVQVPLKDQLRSVDKPSYTILATGHKRWSDEDGNVLRHLTGAEGALIQSFPKDYRLPWNTTLSLIGVGNAMPPKLACALMQPTV